MSWTRHFVNRRAVLATGTGLLAGGVLPAATAGQASAARLATPSSALATAYANPGPLAGLRGP